MHADMHSLKEPHSSPKHEAGFPSSQIYTMKLVISLPFLSQKIILLLRKALLKPLFLSKRQSFLFFPGKQNYL